MSETKKIKILEDILGEHYQSGNERLFYCKKCEHHKKKLSINLSKNKFKCWVCDYAGPVSRLVKRYGNFNHLKEWNDICGTIDIESFDKIFSFEEEKAAVPDIKISLPSEFVSLCNKDKGIDSIEVKKYLNERGIYQKDILKWKIGYCKTGEYESRVIIPSFDLDGKVNYFIGRTFSKKKTRKYMNPQAPKDIIFNELYIDWSKDVIIVEGVFDAIKAENAIPLLGSTLRENSRLFTQIVKNDSPVYIALDPDAEKKAEKLINSLLSYDIEVYKIHISNNIDVGDMSKEEFIEYKKNSTLIKDSDDILLKKIMEI